MRREAIICLGLAAITLALYWPVSRHDFINLDDPDYVTENPTVQAGLTGLGLRWAFGASHAYNWHPLTWLSHMLDCQLFGLKPGPHHLASAGFHIASTILLFLALNQMTGAVWRSALVAALFAWHPLHVESVAWVSERKDVLSALFFMLTLWAYGRFATVQSLKSKVSSPQSTVHGPQSTVGAQERREQPAAWITFHVSRFTHHAPLIYLLSLLFFALGLMSKPMLVTLPFVLLLLDYWPLGRMQNAESRITFHASRFTHHVSRTCLLRLFAEKVPFFALALAAGLLTVRAQHIGGAITSLEQLPLGSRLANVPVACLAYLGKTFWPANLCVFYPYVAVPAWQVVTSVLVLVFLTVACLWQARSRPGLVVGWFWFCVMLLPVIGLVQVGWQALADRYTYLPLIGLFIMLAWGVADLGRRSIIWRVGATLGATVLLGGCLAATRLQLRHWQDSVTLFNHALEVTTGNWLAHNNLGTALADQGEVDEGGEHFRAALQINPGYDDARSNFSRYLAERGKRDEAKAQLEALLRGSPNHARAHRNLGYVLLAEGNMAEGVAQYALARQLRPDDVATPEDLAAALTRQEQSQTALPYLREALGLLPTAAMRVQVAGAWAGQGKFQYALEGYQAALARQPQSPEILNNLAWILATCPEARIRDGAEAVRLAERACELTGFRRAVMVGTLAAAYAEAGRFAEAVATAERACARATESGDETLAGRNQQLLQLYREGRAYHEVTNAAPPGPASP